MSEPDETTTEEPGTAPGAGAAAPRASVEETGPVQRLLRVEVAAPRVDAAFAEAYRELGRRARIRGFRPGRAPRGVLERLYGASVAEDVERVLVTESLPAALLETGVEPVSEPQVESEAPKPGVPFAYQARVEVVPPVEVPDLEGLRGRRPAVSVSDEDVQRELDSLRERRATLVDEEPDTEIVDGHFVTVDYVGRIDGEGFRGGSSQGVVIEVGTGRFVPGFEEQLRGARAGEDRQVRVTFPEDYGAEEVAGRQAEFAVHVAAVKRRQVPELDDEFARALGEFESLDALRERIRGDLRRAREERARGRLRESLMDDLLGRVEIPVPPGLVDRRLQSRLERAHRELHGALPHDDLHARMAQWQEEWRPDAERHVREDLLLDAVAEAEGAVVSDEDVSARVEEMAREQGIDPGRLRKAYDERGLVPALRAELRRERALDALIGRAEIEEFEEAAQG